MNGYEDKYLREKVNRMIARQKEGKIIRTYLKPSIEKGRLFDPCAGEGQAASFLGNALNCETWGVELSPERAGKAQNVMDKDFQAPWRCHALPRNCWNKCAAVFSEIMERSLAR